MIKKPVAPAAPPPPASSAPTAAEKTEHAALGEDIVVVATYDGKWKPEDGKK
jgi:hypothetical protein